MIVWENVEKILAVKTSDYEDGYRRGMVDAALIAFNNQVPHNKVELNTYNSGCAESFYKIINNALDSLKKK